MSDIHAHAVAQEQPPRFRRSGDSREIKARTAAWMAFDDYQHAGLTAFEAFLGAIDRLDEERKRLAE
jgi:hypothetical protein